MSAASCRLEHMFDPARSSATGDSDADYGHVRPLAPGAVDPVRLAALVEGVDAGALVWDPAEEVLFGPAPDIDVAALFAAVDDADSDLTESPADAAPRSGVVDPSVLVPAHMPSAEGMPPNPELAALLDAAGLPELGAYELVEAVAGWQRLAAWVAARQAAAIMELSRRAEMQPVPEGRRIESMNSLRVTGTEVAARRALTPREGEGLVARARVWAEDLPDTVRANRWRTRVVDAVLRWLESRLGCLRHTRVADISLDAELVHERFRSS